MQRSSTVEKKDRTLRDVFLPFSRRMRSILDSKNLDVSDIHVTDYRNEEKTYRVVEVMAHKADEITYKDEGKCVDLEARLPNGEYVRVIIWRKKEEQDV